MGIDLPHVRYVIHWTMAKSLEGFYQESGRVGRDGLPAVSVLYYAKDDASKFAWLIKKNAEKKMKGKPSASAAQKVDHSLVELEGMVNYCIKPMCKRKYVLEHFGENIGANMMGKKSCCDYCVSPRKVEADIQASECMSTVVNSHLLLRASFTDYAGKAGVAPLTGFVKASSVLRKYETKELEQGSKGGFVTFKSRTFEEPTQEDRDAKKHRVISIPEHLRRGMPDPLAAHTKPAGETATKSSSAYASESERLKAELAALQKQKEAALASMGGLRKALSARRSSKFIPTPSLTFKRRR